MDIIIEITRGGNPYMNISGLPYKNKRPENLDAIVSKLRRDYRWAEGFTVTAKKVTESSVEVCSK